MNKRPEELLHEGLEKLGYDVSLGKVICRDRIIIHCNYNVMKLGYVVSLENVRAAIADMENWYANGFRAASDGKKGKTDEGNNRYYLYKVHFIVIVYRCVHTLRRWDIQHPPPHPIGDITCS
jgi:hypothetical protein